MKKYKLSDIGNVVTGTTPITHNKSYYESNDFQFIGPADINRANRYIDFTEKHISKSAYIDYCVKFIDKDDICVSCIGNLGYVGIVKRKCLTNQQINSLTNINLGIALPLYMFYKLKTMKHLLDSIGGSGTALPIINKKLFENIEINIHNLSEQQHIVNILGSIDDKIENNEKIVEKINAYLNLIYQKYFKNILPNEVLGSVIENYDRLRKPLSSRERSDLKKIYPYYGATEIVDYVDNYIFDGDYLLLGEDGTVIDKDGYPIVQRVQGKFWANNHTHILTAKKPIDNNLLELILKNTNVKSAVTGAVQLKINQTNLYNLKISLPDNDVIKNLKSLVLPLFNKRFFIEDENKKLNQLKQFYLKKFFN